MANTNRPSGFTPVRKLDGSPYNGAVSEGTVDASNSASGIFKGDPIHREADGNFIAAALDKPISGVMSYCVYTDALGTIQNSNYLPASTAGVIYYSESRDLVYSVQEDGAGSKSIVSADYGTNTEVVVGSGDTTRQLSAYTIDSDVTGSATAQIRIIKAVPKIDNTISTSASVGSWYTDFEVLVNEQEYDNRTGVGI